MNILIIEDHPLIKIGLKHLIRESAPKAVLTQADSFPAGMALMDTSKFDLLILDIEVPGGQNIKMMDMVRKKQSEIIILIHSGHDEDTYALPYLQAGADGFLSKQSSQEEFKKAFSELMNHGKYVSYRIQQTLLHNISDNNSRKLKNPILSLSRRETRVMELLMEGKWTKEISSILDLKENTISTYKRRIFDKLDVTNELELAKKLSLFKSY